MRVNQIKKMIVNIVPKVSVVVASKNGRKTIEKCLTSLEKQKIDCLEIIVVDGSNDGTAEFIKERFDQIELIELSGEQLIPELWGEGIKAARGDIIAITIAQFVPARNWITKIIESLKPPYSAVGGAIENAESASMGDWALYFCRYSNYMLPFEERSVDDMAGDNAAYIRKDIEPYKKMYENGFWENEINAEMVKDGLTILLTPGIVAVHQRSFGIIPFSIQRYVHGLNYGRKRSGSFSLVKRFMFIILTPLIPIIHLKRIINRVLKRNRHKGKFFFSLPVLLVFISFWTIGECFGYISGIIEKYDNT